MTNAVPAENSATRALEPLAVAVVVILALSWGLNQVSIKLALPEIPSMMQALIRSAVSSLLVALWMRLRGVPIFNRDGTLWPGIAIGLMFGGEFILIYWGLQYTTAIRGTLFIYLAPFFVVLGARFVLPVDRFSPSQWVGLALSFAGMLVAFGVPTPALDARQFIGDLMMVAAGAIWGATTLTIKVTSLNRTTFEKLLLYQLAVSSVMTAVAVLALDERLTVMPSALALGAVAYQTLWVVSLTYLAWFAMIQRYSANRLSAFTFLAPLFGVAAGHFVLGEPLTPAFLAAVAMVAAGLVLVNRAR